MGFYKLLYVFISHASGDQKPGKKSEDQKPGQESGNQKPGLESCDQKPGQESGDQKPCKQADDFIICFKQFSITFRTRIEDKKHGTDQKQ